MQYDQLIQSHKARFRSNNTKNIKFRIAQLKKLKEVIQAYETRIHVALNEDLGKSEFDAYTTETSLILEELNRAIKHVRYWAEPERVRIGLVHRPGKGLIIPEPLGVSLIIGAWNYPFQLSLVPAIAAIGAGNTVILKPSELTSASSRLMAEMINESFDSDYFHVVEGGVPETTELLKHPFDKIFFTGSTTVGKIVYQAAAKQLTPVTLELGGKSPALVTDSCNLKMAARRIVWGKFLNAGQTCISPDYILVDQTVKAQFIEEVKKEIDKNNFSLENNNYAAIVNDRNLERLKGLINYEKVVKGGDINTETRVIAPTVMDNVSSDDAVMQDEIFGPILPIISYETLDEAIHFIKERPTPLAFYLFSTNKKIQKRVMEEVPFGGGGINETVSHIAIHSLPFGGVGGSGIGAYHGEHSFKAFSHYKSVLVKSPWFEITSKYYNRTRKKLSWIRKVV